MSQLELKYGAHVDMWHLLIVTGPCVIIYAINYGLGVVGPEMAMDFGSTKWN